VTARPSARITLPPDSGTPRPTASALAGPSAAPWTAEWHDAFCAAFGEIVVAQQVARDIGRSLEAGDKANATGLAHELQTTVSGLGTTLTGLPSWTGSTDVVTAVTTMLEQDANLATQYLRYLEDKRGGALDRAHTIEGTLRESAIPAVATALAPLKTQGLACPGIELELESP
jgi:hypothetical protein